VTESGFKYAVHEFTSEGSSEFIVESISSVSANNLIDYLVVAGGGGGGGSFRDGAGGVAGGGGGGGGVIFSQGLLSVTPQTYPILV
jgi:hypothetical protein